MAIVIGPTPPGNRRHVRRKLTRIGVDVAEEALVGSVHPNVDHGGARLDHVGPRRHGAAPPRQRECRPSEGVSLEVDRPRVADRYGRVGLEQEMRHRLADNVRAAHDDGFARLGLDSYSASMA